MERNIFPHNEHAHTVLVFWIVEWNKLDVLRTFCTKYAAMSEKSLYLTMAGWVWEPNSFWYTPIRKEGDPPEDAVSVSSCEQNTYIIYIHTYLHTYIHTCTYIHTRRDVPLLNFELPGSSHSSRSWERGWHLGECPL